jgi:phosphate transport system permease protein
LIVNGIISKAPALAPQRDELGEIYTSSESYRLRDMVFENPALIGKTQDIKILADANVDVWVRGQIDRDLPDEQQQLSPEVRKLADEMEAQGVLTTSFNTQIFTNPDSRSSPATSGLAGAFMGSLFMMLIVIFISIPIGVASAIYLEEFAPKNYITDIIEVNINNLAAVPSIVFGLLGAAIFIGWMHLPLSAPLVGGLVLSLMTLPTVIITTRASLKAVPPSIRQAALGLGASRVQTIFHHVLPLALPGILTGAIIGVAQALGETAPLLLIGMSAFVASVPTSPLDQSTALPVQIFLWQGNELRNFFEGRTAAAIIVLLALMIGLNSLAIWLRKKFEVRW